MRAFGIGVAWIGVTATVAGYLAHALLEDKRLFLPGTTTAGHYQLEKSCETCHDPMAGVPQSACLGCHAAELEAADDSHPESKFRDPRNAAYLERLDARKCVTCHGEHDQDGTLSMGVTQPAEFCRECHRDIGTERASHAELAFGTCMNAGCHNYHDNRALTAEHLLEHAGEPALLAAVTRVPLRRAARVGPALAAADTDGPAGHPDIEWAWADSAHATRGVNCSDCHGDGDRWRDTVDRARCASCHDAEAHGFEAGRHGMRATVGLSPMRPELARLPMHAGAANRELDCTSCHDAHAPNVERAAADACLECHADDHSTAWRGTKHATGGVTCATCHLPRVDGVANHNQNDALRPRETMVRPVCQRCHGLEFSLDAIADDNLVDGNYDTEPASHVESVDMARAADQGVSR